MNKLILSAVFLFSLGANASYFQWYCGNGDGTVRIAGGHTENSIFVTERDWDQGTPVETKVELYYDEVSVSYSNETDIERTSNSSCKKGDDYGVGSWTNIKTKKISIAKKDGSTFSEHTLGVSKDRISVNAHIICEESGDSMMMCPKD